MIGTNASFTTHILVEKDINVLEYKPTAQNILFCFAYLLIAGFAFFMTISTGNSMFGAIVDKTAFIQWLTPGIYLLLADQ